MPARDEAAKSARDWLVGIGVDLLQHANWSDGITSGLLDKVAVVAALAELPDEMVLRVRCFPNVFNLRA